MIVSIILALLVVNSIAVQNTCTPQFLLPQTLHGKYFIIQTLSISTPSQQTTQRHLQVIVINSYQAYLPPSLMLFYVKCFLFSNKLFSYDSIHRAKFQCCTFNSKLDSSVYLHKYKHGLDFSSVEFYLAF